MGEIKGVLFAVIAGKGSRSESPKYYIRPLDEHKNRWSVILVRKKTKSWENVPELHKHLEKPVLIRGEIIETKSTITVDYIEVKELKTLS